MTARWEPKSVSRQLLDLTHDIGKRDRNMVILAEGNTSQRLADGRVMVKASGSNMRKATKKDFVAVEVEPLIELIRSESATQKDLTAALTAGEHDGAVRRASIETLIHVAVQAIEPVAFVGHSHPTSVVGLLASVNAATAFDRAAYSDEAVVIGKPLFVPYAQPGIDLGRVFYHTLLEHYQRVGEMPQLILLGNHGIVAIAPTTAGVLGVSEMAIKGAEVRSIAANFGGVEPLSAESIEKFFARDDIAERRRHLSSGTH